MPIIVAFLLAIWGSALTYHIGQSEKRITAAIQDNGCTIPNEILD